MAIFFAFTCLGAPLIQPNKHFAAILNRIRLQGNISLAQFTALVAGSKPKMQGENPPHGFLNGYGIFCRHRMHHSEKSLPSSSSVGERVALGRLPLPCTTRFLRLASSTFREKANSSSFRMFILVPESDRNLWIPLCSPVKVLGSYSSQLIFLYVFKELSQEVVKFFR